MSAPEGQWAESAVPRIERWVPLTVFVGLGCLLVALLLGRGAVEDSPEKGSNTLIHEGLSIQPQSDRAVIGVLDRTRQRLIFTNLTEGTLRDLSIRQVGHPGFTKDSSGSCWQDARPVCWSLSDSTHHRARSIDLPRGSSTSVLIPLVADRHPGRFEIVVRVGWLDVDNQRQTLDLAAQPVEILAEGQKWARWLATGVESLQKLIKDLALPLVILLLGFLFKSAESRRAEISEVWSPCPS